MSKRGQSTAEYAILIGLVIAVAAGVLGGLLKGGISQKQRQALGLLDAAGNEDLGAETTFTARSFTEEARETKVLSGDSFVDAEVLKKGGAIEKKQEQKTQSKAITVERY